MFLRRTTRRIVCMLADTHAGSRLALMDPEVQLERVSDEPGGDVEIWTPQPTETQIMLWEHYQRHIAQLRDFAGKDEILVFHLGDATQGERFGPVIHGTTPTDQRAISVANLRHLVGLPNVQAARIITGTQVHVPDHAEGRIAYTLYKELGRDVRCAHHSRVSVSGVVFDVAHHGPHPGTRDWLKGNVAQIYLRDRIYRDRRLGKQPARVYARGHYHVWVHRTDNQTWEREHRIADLVILPSYSVPSWFWRKVGKSDPELYTGMMLFEILGERLGEIVPLVEVTDLRSEEVL